MLVNCLGRSNSDVGTKELKDQGLGLEFETCWEPEKWVKMEGVFKKQGGVRVELRNGQIRDGE